MPGTPSPWAGMRLDLLEEVIAHVPRDHRRSCLTASKHWCQATLQCVLQRDEVIIDVSQHPHCLVRAPQQDLELELLRRPAVQALLRTLSILAVDEEGQPTHTAAPAEAPAPAGPQAHDHVGSPSAGSSGPSPSRSSSSSGGSPCCSPARTRDLYELAPAAIVEPAPAGSHAARASRNPDTELLCALPELRSLCRLAIDLPVVPQPRSNCFHISRGVWVRCELKREQLRRCQQDVTHALQDALHALSRLTALSLSIYSFPPSMGGVLSTLSCLRELTLSAHEPAPNQLYIRWRSLPHLTYLSLVDVFPGPGLPDLPSLELLYLEFSEGGAALPGEEWRLPRLTSLHLCGVEIGCLGKLEDGATMPALQQLYLSAFHPGASFALLPLCQLTTLWLADMYHSIQLLSSSEDGSEYDSEEEEELVAASVQHMTRYLAPLSQCASLLELGLHQPTVWVPPAVLQLTTLTALDFGEGRYLNSQQPLPEGPYLDRLAHLNLGVVDVAREDAGAEAEGRDGGAGAGGSRYLPACLARCTALHSLQVLAAKDQGGWDGGEGQWEDCLPLGVAEVELLSKMPHLRRLVIGTVPASRAGTVLLSPETMEAIQQLQGALPGLHVTWVAEDRD